MHIRALFCLYLSASSCQGPDGPSTTHITLISDEGLEQLSGTHYDGYATAPTLPADYEDRLAVLRADTSGSINAAQVHPKYLQVALQTVTATSLDPTKCTAQVTELEERTAKIKYTLMSQTDCLIRYTAQIRDTAQYQAPAEHCWSYRIEAIQHASFAYVRTGREVACPSR